MGKMLVSLDEQAEGWVREQASENPEAFVNDLLHRQQTHQRKLSELKAAIQAGLDSGVSSRTPEQIMADVKARLKADGRI